MFLSTALLGCALVARASTFAKDQDYSGTNLCVVFPNVTRYSLPQSFRIALEAGTFMRETIKTVRRATSCRFRKLANNSDFFTLCFCGRYQSQGDAMAQKLVYVDPTTGRAIIKVDNTTTGNYSQYGRASVKMLSQEPITQNSLVIMDAHHLPFGVRMR
jgi:hypothetical protein